MIETGDPLVALAICERDGATIRLLLTDIMMPGMNGLELAERVSAKKPDLKVIFMSGTPQEALPEEFKNHFLKKPFTPQQLLTKLSELFPTTPNS